MNALQFDHVEIKRNDFTLHDITFTLPLGNVIAVIGSNGAGKSTLMQAIFQKHQRCAGQIQIFHTCMEENRAEIMQRTAFLQSSFPFPQTYKLSQLSQMFATLYPSFQSAIFETLCKKACFPITKHLSTFSLGQQKRIELFLALARKVDLLIMDEPFSTLDPIVRRLSIQDLHTFMLDEQHSIFIASHMLEDIDKLADYVIFLDHGCITLIERMDYIQSLYYEIQGKGTLKPALQEHMLVYQCQDQRYCGIWKADRMLPPDDVYASKCDLETLLYYLARRRTQ